MVTSIQSGLSRVVFVELLDSEFCMVEPFCLIPDFVVFS